MPRNGVKSLGHRRRILARGNVGRRLGTSFIYLQTYVRTEFARSNQEAIGMRRLIGLTAMPVLPAIIVHLPVLGTTDAYLDPGTGSIIIQVVIATFLGGMFAAKLYWSKIRTFFRNLFSSRAKHESSED